MPHKKVEEGKEYHPLVSQESQIMEEQPELIIEKKDDIEKAIEITSTCKSISINLNKNF